MNNDQFGTELSLVSLIERLHCMDNSNGNKPGKVNKVPTQMGLCYVGKLDEGTVLFTVYYLDTLYIPIYA
jgi:hypothetical protein